jgi:hypothetical protein
LVESNTSEVTKSWLSMLGFDVSPYCRASRRDLAGLPAERARFGGAQPALQRSPRDGAFGLLGLRLGLLALAGQLFVDLVGRLVDERARPEHDLHGVTVRELAARPVHAALPRERRDGHVARQAALQADQPLQVFAQHELLQVAFDEHLDRLFAEVLIEALGVAVLRARARDERARRRRRLQPQRERRAGQAEHDRHGHDQARAARSRAGQRREET